MKVAKVHKCFEGPLEVGDGTYYNMCLAQLSDGDWAEVELHYQNFNAAYDDAHWLNRSPYPLEVDEQCLTSTLN